MSKLRLSAHKLAIEKSRYTKPLTPVSERMCKKWLGNKVEDEYYFLIECDKYQIQWEDLLTKISINCKHVGSNNSNIASWGTCRK